MVSKMSENPVAGTFTVENLLHNLYPIIQSELAGRSREIPSIEQKIDARMQQIMAQNEDLMVDELSGKYLSMTSLVLASFEVLEPYFGDSDKRTEVIKDAMCQILIPRVKQYVKDRFDVDPLAPGEAFSKVSENFIKRGRQFLGDSFDYGEEPRGEGERVFTVSRCFFYNFFKRHNLPELTGVFCALDTIWASEFNEGKYDIEFDRPTVLSKGDDICRFHFVQTDE